nr:reverse transcriptase domain-containing protein [Tanacetum cinerariifolium]
MSTRSSARNLFPPLDNPELTIRRRSLADPTLLNDFEMAAEGNGDLPVPDLRTMEELCQPSLNGRGGPIASIAIQAMNFRLKNDMIQQSIKVNGVTDDALHLKYFPPSMVTKLRNEITNFCQRPDESLFEAWERYKLSLIDVITTTRGTFMKRRPEECYDLIENMTAHHNDWDTSAQRTTVGQTQNVYAVGAYQGGFNQNQNRNYLKQNFQNQNRNQRNHHPQGNTQGRNQFFQGSSHGHNPPISYQARAYQALGYQAPVHQPSIPQPQVVTTNEFTNFMKANDAILKNMQTNMTSLTISNVELKNMFGQFIKMYNASSSGLETLLVEHETEVTKDTVPPTNNRSTKDVQAPVVQTETPILNSKPVVASIIQPVVAPVSALKPNQKPSIPYLSMIHDQNLHDKANDQKEKFFQIFQDLNFNISFADALILMPKFSLTIKTLLTNKDKLSELARTSLNEHCSAVLLKKLPEKLGDPGKFLVLSFLKTGRALIYVFKGELTLRVGKKAITFNLDQTSRYSANYNDMTANQIDIIDMACEEYSQEVLGFSDVIRLSLPYYDLIVSTSSLTLTPFGDSDFLLEEELKIYEAKTDKSSIDEPPEIELKDLHPHLEYIFLEGDDKLTVIIAKDLSNEEKTALITEDFKPAVQHQRRVDPKLYDVIKKEVEKLLDAGLIYPISDSPWISLVHCVPKKGGITVVENEENELIPTRLVTGSCIEVDIAKVDVIAKLPHPTTVKGIRSFFGHAGFYRRFIQDFSKIARPMTCLLEKDTPFFFSKECVEAFQTLKRKLIEAPILIAPDLDLPFELMCDASDFAIGGVYTARKPLTFSRLATIDPPGDIMARTTPPRRCLTPDSIGPRFTVMPKTWSNLVTFVNVKERFCNVMKCHKIPSKFARFSTFGHRFHRAVLVFTREQIYTHGRRLLVKWVKAKALPINNARVVCKFLKSLFVRFGTPRAIISDRGMHFCNDQFVKVMLKYGVTHHLATAYHPQTSRQVEVSNRGLKTYKTPIGCTPYKHFNRKACHLPIELKHKAYWALKHANFDLQTAGDHRKFQLNELNELRDQAYENSLVYKEKTNRLHNSKIKDRVFNIGDRILLFSSRLKIFSGKLKTCWSGPFTITHVFPYDTIELS